MSRTRNALMALLTVSLLLSTTSQARADCSLTLARAQALQQGIQTSGPSTLEMGGGVAFGVLGLAAAFLFPPAVPLLLGFGAVLEAVGVGSKVGPHLLGQTPRNPCEQWFVGLDAQQRQQALNLFSWGDSYAKVKQIVESTAGSAAAGRGTAVGRSVVTAARSSGGTAARAGTPLGQPR